MEHFVWFEDARVVQKGLRLHCVVGAGVLDVLNVGADGVTTWGAGLG